jgi:DNA modification methylase
MEYSEFIADKKKSVISSGFLVDEKTLNSNMFDFQKHIVKKALKKGRYAIFADCGLGKTLMQLEWARQVSLKTNKPVLILAPLAVVQQTIEEGHKFGIGIHRLVPSDWNSSNYSNGSKVFITNYDQLENIDYISYFSGVALDESSILKGKDSKTKNKLLSFFEHTSYKLCCTATPSPNDHTELGNHAEFLGHMGYTEMLAMFFVHDGGETSKWRLRKHATDKFWQFVCQWSISVDNPETLGFNMDGYNLPKINYIEHVIDTHKDDGLLFRDGCVSATEIHRDLRDTLDKRVNKVCEIIDGLGEDQCIVWGLQNAETDKLRRSIDGSINIQGSDKPQKKADNLIGFAHQDYQNLITKTSIASFGMNYQQCHNMIFSSYDFKFEAFYQAVRRCYRFGQTKTVNVHIIIPDTQLNVRSSILEKEKKHKKMISNMTKYSNIEDFAVNKNQIVNDKEIKTEDYWIMNGDCVQEVKKIEDESVHLTVFSPPFADLYVYSDKSEDMGNASSYDEFCDHFNYLLPELNRVMKTGRIVAMHCMDIPLQKGKHGIIGLRDFSGMLIDMMSENGFVYHARTTLWKDPVIEMQRTKALGLLHKQIKKDSSMSRVGIPDYILFFRKIGVNEEPIVHQADDPTKPDYLPVDLWQKYASPVWMDINYSRTLQYTTARDSNDEKHICPLQLDTIERILHLYSNEGDTVLSTFGGIGSEGVSAIRKNRKSISIELKESYFNINKKNHEMAVKEKDQLELFNF